MNVGPCQSQLTGATSDSFYKNKEYLYTYTVHTDHIDCDLVV